jgi:hypothetical protein
MFSLILSQALLMSKPSPNSLKLQIYLKFLRGIFPAEADTFTNNAPRRVRGNQFRGDAPANWKREEKLHPSNYHDCSHVKEEQLKRKA